jgi:hypothetical protein
LNLFEIARPDETRLASVLAELFSLEAAGPGELEKAHDRALALVPADMAKRSVFLPMAVEGDTLTITVAEPLPESLENELAFALGVRVVQRVAPAFRVLEAIARDYGQPLDRRVDRLIVRLSNPNADAQMDDGPGLMDLSVRQPPRAPSMIPSAPAPPMPAAAPPEERRRTTHQGFPVVTPEMIAAALKAERGPSSKPETPAAPAVETTGETPAKEPTEAPAKEAAPEAPAPVAPAPASAGAEPAAETASAASTDSNKAGPATPASPAAAATTESAADPGSDRTGWAAGPAPGASTSPGASSARSARARRGATRARRGDRSRHRPRRLLRFHAAVLRLRRALRGAW